MSRANYLKHLEHDLNASKKIINDLCQENYQLKLILREIQKSTPVSKQSEYQSK